MTEYFTHLKLFINIIFHKNISSFGNFSSMLDCMTFMLTKFEKYSDKNYQFKSYKRTKKTFKEIIPQQM